jgi:iron-regulated transporter 1
MSFINFSPKYNGVILSAIIFGAWNLISYFLELSLLNGVYSSIPQLQKEIKQTTKLSKKLNHIKNLYKGWYVYMKQGIIVLPSIALAVLYLTVLSFDSVTIGYARSQHIGETLVSIFQAVGNVTGIIGTFVFQAMRNRCRVPLRIIGLIGSTYQLFFLIGCFISIWLPGSPFEVADREYKTASDFSNCTTTVTNATDSTDTVTNVEKTSNKFFTSPCQNYTSIMVLLTTMALSRFGLWMIDLAINQSIQETVSEKERGVVGGLIFPKIFFYLNSNYFYNISTIN